MGDQIATSLFSSCCDELEGIYKEATPLSELAHVGRSAYQFAKGIGSSGVSSAGRRLSGIPAWASENVTQFANRVAHPIKGMKAGWSEMGVRGQMGRQAQELAKGEGAAARRHKNALDAWRRAGSEATSKPVARTDLEATLANKKRGWLRRAFGAGDHLQDVARGGVSPGWKGAFREGGMRGVFGEASKSGWTGQGNLTKYLPIGNKSMMTGFGAMGASELAHPRKVGPTGEGGAGEIGLREMGSAAGWVAGMGLPIVPMMTMAMGGYHLGGKAGRVIDRLRGGASVGTAVNAPTPSEAMNDLYRVQRYYG